MKRVAIRHTFSRDIPIDREDTQELKELIADIEQGSQDARHVARLAVMAGYLLIGTVVPKIRHYPVAARQHRYRDLNAREDKQYAPDGSYLLQAGTNADIALMCGLFGDINDRQQRIDRCKPITSLDSTNFGWGYDAHKSFSQPLYEFEEAHARPHARPELINACIEQPFTGYIECVSGDGAFTSVEHEIGQFVTTRSHRTLLRIPLRGDIDLPYDVIATDYADVSDMSR